MIVSGIDKDNIWGYNGVEGSVSMTPLTMVIVREEKDWCSSFAKRVKE